MYYYLYNNIFAPKAVEEGKQTLSKFPLRRENGSKNNLSSVPHHEPGESTSLWDSHSKSTWNLSPQKVTEKYRRKF